jgi:extradiol dioxygenase family protein
VTSNVAHALKQHVAFPNQFAVHAHEDTLLENTRVDYGDQMHAAQGRAASHPQNTRVDYGDQIISRQSLQQARRIGGVQTHQSRRFVARVGGV